ncbi:hypothetical protein EYF80_059339 [Liparis tanakae]|uniref:Uncharacterized protein n=1 Tax=Liparis tanakae TaxID=230148 RepID=A0A4Z2EP24_9TELE|nr:hypothetical protein EYF80_059339 [Liparis tanakae]
MLLSSIWATVKIRILHFLHTWRSRQVLGRRGRVGPSSGPQWYYRYENVVFQELKAHGHDGSSEPTLCCRSRKGSSISIPPSCTTHHTSMVPSPRRSVLDCGSLACLQVPGQAMSTVLCFMPPRPAVWMRWETPSRRLDDTTTWQKPLVRSSDMADLMFWTERDRKRVRTRPGHRAGDRAGDRAWTQGRRQSGTGRSCTGQAVHGKALEDVV